MNKKYLKDMRAILRSIELNNSVLENIQLNSERELFVLEDRRDAYEDKGTDYWDDKAADLDERIDILQEEMVALEEISSSMKTLVELMRHKFGEIEGNVIQDSISKQSSASRIERNTTVVFGDRDPLFDEVARLIVSSNTASTSSLQRRYSINYNRANKIMDQLEAAGIVGSANGGKPRTVLVDAITLEEILSTDSRN